MRRRTAWVWAAVLLVAACSDAGGDQTEDARDVAVVGDSITAFSTEAITSRFAGDDEVVIFAEVGKTFASSQSTADVAADSSPAVVIIELGTNDVWRTRPVDEIAAEMDEMLQKFDGVCVAMVNVNENTSNAVSLDGTIYDNALARQVNQLMAERVTNVIDWNGAVNEDPARYLDKGTIHPTEDGKALLASLMESGADACTD